MSEAELNETEAKVRMEPTFVCTACDIYIEQCKYCTEFFEEGQTIICGPDFEHYHKDCYAELKRDARAEDCISRWLKWSEKNW